MVVGLYSKDKYIILNECEGTYVALQPQSQTASPVSRAAGAQHSTGGRVRAGLGPVNPIGNNWMIYFG